MQNFKQKFNFLNFQTSREFSIKHKIDYQSINIKIQFKKWIFHIYSYSDERWNKPVNMKRLWFGPLSSYVNLVVSRGQWLQHVAPHQCWQWSSSSDLRPLLHWCQVSVVRISPATSLLIILICSLENFLVQQQNSNAYFWLVDAKQY